MSDSIAVTILVENTAFGPGIRGEHGLAFWIEVGSRHVLFDTGHRPSLMRSALQDGCPAGRSMKTQGVISTWMRHVPLRTPWRTISPFSSTRQRVRWFSSAAAMPGS